MKIFITGAAGYIGGMLADRFGNDKRVKQIVALDIKPPPSHFSISNTKISWIKYNLSDAGWEEKVLTFGIPDVIIHCAYVIRTGYGKKRAWQIKSNVIAAERVFNFVFKNNIKRFIHFSTAASYGAFRTNSIKRRFKEDDPFRDSKYVYAQDKKIIEEKLYSLFKKLKSKTQVLIIRPAAVTGPRGQFMYKRFGILQMIQQGLPIIPITHLDSARQFVHEDDIFEAMQLMTFGGIPDKYQYEIFNISPTDFLLLKDMAKAIGKPTIRIPRLLGKLAFAILWHFSRGRIPTVPPSIDSYTYPIILDGSKVTKFGFHYGYNSSKALKADSGYYTKFVVRK